MEYEITKNCEIANVKYNKGDIVEEKGFIFYPSVMAKTEKNKTGGGEKSSSKLDKTKKTEKNKTEGK